MVSQPCGASYAAAIKSLQARAGELHGVSGPVGGQASGQAGGQARRKFRLEEMQALVEALGHPERRFRSVLIAGTNGKGSTAATLGSILNAAGYRTGMYTSPHLTRVNERIRIAGAEGRTAEIGDEDFARLYFRVDEAAARLIAEGRLPDHPSFFEALTAVAFEAFAEAQVDVAVLEVGMGGRLDATNVAEPLLSVITDVSLDHMEWLGNTIAEIAREKAGILRRDGVLVTLPQHPQANQAIGEAAAELNARGVSATEYVPPAERPGETTGLRNRYALAAMGERIEVDSPLAGAHQRRNIALAIAAAVELRKEFGFAITPAQIEEGIRRTEWPGRLERMEVAGRAPVLLDVAHNPAGAWALRAAVSAMETEGPRVLVFGCMRDKAVEEMAQILFPLFERVVAVTAASPRAAKAEDLEKAAERTGVAAAAAASGEDALEQAWAAAGQKGMVVVAGSVYLVGEVRPLLTARRVTRR